MRKSGARLPPLCASRNRETRSLHNDSVAASPSDGGSQRLLSCSEPGERNEKDDLKATNTQSRDCRYRTIHALVKLPIGVSVLGRSL